MKRLERLRLEEMIMQDSKACNKGFVTRRSDDVHGQGFGNVRTGFVNTTKLSFLQRSSSVDRYDSRLDFNVDSPASSDGRGRSQRVTFADTPPPGSATPTMTMADLDQPPRSALKVTPIQGGFQAAQFEQNGSASSMSSQMSTGSSKMMSASNMQSSSQMSQMSSSKMEASSSKMEMSSSKMAMSSASSFSSSSKSFSSSSQSQAFGTNKSIQMVPGLGQIDDMGENQYSCSNDLVKH